MLLERSWELQRLRDALRECRQGRGSTLLVAGEAGIGKTSLLRAFADEVAGEATVLRGACDDLHTARVLGPFRDMFRAESPDREGFLELLQAALSDNGRPAVVMVDDLHWADAATLDVVRYLARRIGALSGMLVLSYRPGEVDAEHPLRRVLGTLATAGTVRLDLSALSDGTVAWLATQHGRDPATLIAAVGGNPFYLTEVLASDGPEVPATVRDAVIGRVLALREPTRRALELLSVIPTEADRWILEPLLAGPTPAVLASAARSGIVCWTDERVRFRHELARRAIESSLPDEARVELNRRVLYRLIEADAPASRLVHHATEAGDRAALSRYACIAADEAAAAGAHSETAAYCELGLRQADLLEPPTVARLHGLAARALYALGRFGSAAEHAEAAVHAWERSGEASLELGAVLLVSSRMATLNGRREDAWAGLARALDVLRPLGASRPLAQACAARADLETLEGNGAAAMDWCDQALALAAELGAPDVQALAWMCRGIARIDMGDASGLDEMRDAAELARRIDQGDIVCRATTNLATCLTFLGRHREAAPYLDLAESAAREHGMDYILFHVLAGRSHVDVYCGRFAEAEARLRDQLRTERDLAAMMILPMALLGRILARRDDPEAAQLLRRAWDIAVRSRQAPRIALAGCALVEQAWLAGDLATLRAVAVVVESISARAHYHYHLGDVRRYLRRAGVEVAGFPGCPPGFAAGIAGDHSAAAAAWEAAGNPYEQALEETESADAGTALGGVRRLDALGATAPAGRARRALVRLGITGVPRGPRSGTRAHPGGLTARQHEVLALLAEGLTNPGIAQRLYLSPRTVDNHVAVILARLGATNRADAVASATRAGWLKPE